MVEARGTQDVLAAQRSGGEEQCIAATERPAPGAGRGQWSVLGAGAEVGLSDLSLRGKTCRDERKGGRGGVRAWRRGARANARRGGKTNIFPFSDFLFSDFFFFGFRV